MSSDRSSARPQLLLRLLASLVAFAASPRAGAESPAALTEYQVEAAFLYNFAKYVSWPTRAFAAATDPILIGILGDDPFGDDLVRAVTREKPVQGRSFRVVHARNAADLVRCHLVFISRSEDSRLAQHLASLRRAGSPALTVGESPAFLAAGGAIRFVVEDKKVRFEINARAAEAAGISISSKLLSLARNRERS